MRNPHVPLFSSPMCTCVDGRGPPRWSLQPSPSMQGYRASRYLANQRPQVHYQTLHTPEEIALRMISPSPRHNTISALIPLH